MPHAAYAKRAREICDEKDALLIVDDVRAGFRMARDCSWSLVGVQPDLSCWGKAIANGYPISALLGSNKARAAASQLYVTGSYWFAAVAMAASLATLKEIQNTDYLERTQALASRLRDGIANSAQAHGFGIRQTGPAQMPLILFDDDKDFRVGYGFASEMVKRGIYVHPWHNMFMCAALTDGDIDLALDAAEGAFKTMKANRAALEPHPALLALMASRS
jgi:glutamate-1-semialdehyde 2,1-aminomutase